MFDLPHPFGPTMPTTSVSKWTTVLSQNDLKPLIRAGFVRRIGGTCPQR